MKPIGTIVLAAGGATRFGSPKLLAQWWGRPLVEWALRTAPDDGPRIAVVGKETATLRPLFAALRLRDGAQPAALRRPRVVARDRPRADAGRGRARCWCCWATRPTSRPA